jgi:hypothetical protein
MSNPHPHHPSNRALKIISSLPLFLFCFALGFAPSADAKTKKKDSRAPASVNAKADTKDLKKKQAKLKKLGVKQKKIDLVMKAEKKLTKDLAAAAKKNKGKPVALKKAKEKLNKAHAKFLKSTLGAKTYAAFNTSKGSSKDMSKIAKSSKPKKAKKEAILESAPPAADVYDAQYQSPAESADAAPTQEAAVQQDPSTAVASLDSSPAPEAAKTESSSVAPSASPQEEQPMQLEQPAE